MGSIEPFVVFTVAAFYFPIMPWSVSFDSLMRNTIVILQWYEPKVAKKEEKSVPKWYNKFTINQKGMTSSDTDRQWNRGMPLWHRSKGCRDSQQDPHGITGRWNGAIGTFMIGKNSLMFTNRTKSWQSRYCIWHWPFFTNWVIYLHHRQPQKIFLKIPLYFKKIVL